MWLHTASIKSTIGNKTRFFCSPFYVSTSSRLNSAGEFRSSYVAVCSTALRSATEENESGGYVTFRVRLKKNSIVAWRIGWDSNDVTGLVTTEHIRNKY